MQFDSIRTILCSIFSPPSISCFWSVFVSCALLRHLVFWVWLAHVTLHASRLFIPLYCILNKFPRLRSHKLRRFFSFPALITAQFPGPPPPAQNLAALGFLVWGKLFFIEAFEPFASFDRFLVDFISRARHIFKSSCMQHVILEVTRSNFCRTDAQKARLFVSSQTLGVCSSNTAYSMVESSNISTRACLIFIAQ